MSVAITLTLDQITALQVSNLCNALPDYTHLSAYPPHLTLALYGDHVDVRDIDAAMATSTDSWGMLPVTLAGIGLFPGVRSTLWLAPVPTVELLGRHATLHKALADVPSHPHYEIGAWVPHVAIGTTILANDAIEVLTSVWAGKIVGWLNCLDLVRLDPIEVLSRRPLKA